MERDKAPTVPPAPVDGGLLRHGRDASGQYYRRNRYYDATSGRFTQEDPIGLAGGINLYGYANGDPIGYSDPYGLSAVKCPPKCPGEVRGVAIGGTIGAGAGLLLTGVCASASWGICAAGAPAIIGASTGLGASIGGLAGYLSDRLNNDRDQARGDGASDAGEGDASAPEHGTFHVDTLLSG
jgi:RHS repeat-associated protein